MSHFSSPNPFNLSSLPSGSLFSSEETNFHTPGLHTGQSRSHSSTHHAYQYVSQPSSGSLNPPNWPIPRPSRSYQYNEELNNTHLQVELRQLQQQNTVLSTELASMK